MRVLILHEKQNLTSRWQTAFGTRNHAVYRAGSPEEAMLLLRQQPFDLFVFDMLIGQESGLSAALLCEFHQPQCATILVSDYNPALQEDLFARLSSLKSVQTTGISPRDLVAIAESVVLNAGRGCVDLRRALPEICVSCAIRRACVAAQPAAEQPAPSKAPHARPAAAPTCVETEAIAPTAALRFAPVDRATNQAASPTLPVARSA